MQTRSACRQNSIRIWYVNLMDKVLGLNNAVSEESEVWVIGTSVHVVREIDIFR